MLLSFCFFFSCDFIQAKCVTFFLFLCNFFGNLFPSKMCYFLSITFFCYTLSDYRTGYTSELYLGHQVYYSERQTHSSEARADEDAAGVALHYLHLLATDAHVDVNTQLCLPLQGLTLHSPLERTDGSDVNHTPTCSHVSKAVTSSCGKGLCVIFVWFSDRILLYCQTVAYIGFHKGGGQGGT